MKKIKELIEKIKSITVFDCLPYIQGMFILNAAVNFAICAIRLFEGKSSRYSELILYCSLMAIVIIEGIIQWINWMYGDDDDEGDEEFDYTPDPEEIPVIKEENKLKKVI